MAWCRLQPSGLGGGLQTVLHVPYLRPLPPGHVAPQALQVPRTHAGACGPSAEEGGERWEGMERGEQDCSRAAAESTPLSLCARLVSVGVSSGAAFCGFTGHPERFEHTGRAPLS